MLNNISKIVLYILCAITIVITALFFFGGNVDPDAEYVEPVYTNAMIGMMYACFFLTAFCTLVATLWQFIIKLSANKGSAIKTVVSFSLVAVVLIVSYFVSSGEEITLIGDGSVVGEDTVRIVDMMIYTIYVQSVVAILLMIFGPLAKKIK